MREIVLDTETTGLDPKNGDRIVEIGCIELDNHMPSGDVFHRYINPERPMPSAAEAIHGLSDAFLSDKPKFAEIADDFLSFVDGAVLVIHNAVFDIGFLNAEFARIDGPSFAVADAIDTVGMARRKFPGAPASLDALCRRFDIDNSVRTKHGALLDSELLAEVYLELIGGRQPGLALAQVKRAQTDIESGDRSARPPRPHAPTAEEAAAHAEFIEKLTNPVWTR